MNPVINSTLVKYPNLVIGKDGCMYCDRAKELLDINFVDYVYLRNTDDPKLAELVKVEFEHSTYPHIFLNMKFVGGYTEARSMFSSY